MSDGGDAGGGTLGVRAQRIVVLGNSVSFLMLPPRSGPADRTYGEWTRDLLREAGVPAEVWLEGRWFEFLVEARRHYQERVRAHLPDVLVVNFGLNESQPWLLPVGFLRHLIQQDRDGSRLARSYRHRVVPPVWREVRRYRRWASARVGERTWQTHPDRFAASLRQLVRTARIELDCLVLVCDVPAPGPLLLHFLPGQERRHATYQSVIARVVAELDDPRVRLVPASGVVPALGMDAALADGMHLTPAGHAYVGRLLADEVLDDLRRRG